MVVDVMMGKQELGISLYVGVLVIVCIGVHLPMEMPKLEMPNIEMPDMPDFSAQMPDIGLEMPELPDIGAKMPDIGANLPDVKEIYNNINPSEVVEGGIKKAIEVKDNIIDSIQSMSNAVLEPLGKVWNMKQDEIDNKSENTNLNDFPEDTIGEIKEISQDSSEEANPTGDTLTVVEEEVKTDESMSDNVETDIKISHEEIISNEQQSEELTLENKEESIMPPILEEITVDIENSDGTENSDKLNTVETLIVQTVNLVENTLEIEDSEKTENSDKLEADDPTKDTEVIENTDENVNSDQVEDQTEGIVQTTNIEENTDDTKNSDELSTVETLIVQTMNLVENTLEIENSDNLEDDDQTKHAEVIENTDEIVNSDQVEDVQTESIVQTTNIEENTDETKNSDELNTVETLIVQTMNVFENTLETVNSDTIESDTNSQDPDQEISDKVNPSEKNENTLKSESTDDKITKENIEKNVQIDVAAGA